MFSVAVKGYGIVIWDGDGEWRTFSATESLSATLAARVENALEMVLTSGRRDRRPRGAPLARRGRAAVRRL